MSEIIKKVRGWVERATWGCLPPADAAELLRDWDERPALAPAIKRLEARVATLERERNELTDDVAREAARADEAEGKLAALRAELEPLMVPAGELADVVAGWSPEACGQ